MRINKAKYQRAILPEHRGNPLIEALPRKLELHELGEKLSYYPNRSVEETKLEPLERLEYLSRLKALRQPQAIYLAVFRAIEIALKEGYSAKCPLSPTTMNYLHYSLEDRPKIEPKTGFFKPKGCGITIIGESGVGKTCMLDQILGYFPDVIVHQRYQGFAMPLRQVVWMKIDCPDDSSVKGLCHRILEELDRKLGFSQTKPARTIALLIGQIEAKIKSSFLGMLVIDEMQNLKPGKTGGGDRLLRFLHNLVNNLGVPILFCANPPFDDLLSKSFKSARRAENGGYFDIKLLANIEEEWGLFVDELWDLQWTNVETPLTEELSDKLYSLSVGNMDLAVRIFAAAQRLLIGSSDERLSEQALEKGASIAIRATRSATEEMRRNLEISYLKRARPQSQVHSVKRSDSDLAKKRPVSTLKGKFVEIPGDLSRPHHPEFADSLIKLINAENLDVKIHDPCLFQRASEEVDPVDLLKKSGIFCENPLTAFS
ncbi:ATP-binding protein [Microbulbifer sp. CnH-101-E]|uniref:ATP-binding protein n=1 Tax=unclassified Microbulbifer TaxID=2619833 RepID=UPI0040398873